MSVSPQRSKDFQVLLRKKGAEKEWWLQRKSSGRERGHRRGSRSQKSFADSQSAAHCSSVKYLGRQGARRKHNRKGKTRECKMYSVRAQKHAPRTHFKFKIKTDSLLVKLLHVAFAHQHQLLAW